MKIETIRATASYHRALAGLFWMLEDEMEAKESNDSPFNLAIRQVLKTFTNLEASK